MSAEDRVCYRLLDFYTSLPEIEVHSYHPPSSKGYQGGLVRIPKREGGVRTRDRYHVDFIFQIDGVLVLQELKGKASELESDILKLNEILSQYSVPELTAIIAARVPKGELLSQVKTVIPAVGYEVKDAVLPEHIVQFIASSSGVQMIVGADVQSEGRKILARAIGK